MKRYFCKAGVKGIQVGQSNMSLIQSRRPPKGNSNVQIICHFLSIHPWFSQTCVLLLSSATWDDACNPGASYRRRAHSGCGHHVFHQETCTSISTHLHLSFSRWPSSPIPVTIMYPRIVPCAFQAIDFSTVLIYSLHSAHSSVLSLPRNWTSIGPD